MENHNNGDEFLELPIANVERIMKKIIPQKGKISKEAKKTMQECANEFISFVTSEAAQRCHYENRRTLNGDDICWAFASSGLDNYAEVFAKYLLKYREVERIKVDEYKCKITQRLLPQDDDDKEQEDNHRSIDGEIGETSSPN
ncbi:nuclear transcription factor Y subunit B-4 [Cucumis melo var. makuwa]|uniref:Nuclear transcription factor Y subunit B-4 n=2 Tax=Cucumis melo TaxID=3656 RepID=A0A5A7U6S7_CUCMM|nr:nuclear transcription factor Y subunit B-4 [Cucumis melo]KAA0050890.1 nuclear transcription factor Y subunit B-4 [Cucumis melo var. makuwa]